MLPQQANEQKLESAITFHYLRICEPVQVYTACQYVKPFVIGKIIPDLGIILNRLRVNLARSCRTQTYGQCVQKLLPPKLGGGVIA